MRRVAIGVGFLGVFLLGAIAGRVVSTVRGADHELVIEMGENDKSNPAVAAPCVATSVNAPVLVVKRSHTIDVRIEHRPGPGCEELQKRRVDIRLTTPIMGPQDPAVTGWVRILQPNRWASVPAWLRIRAQVSPREAEAKDGLHKYDIFYMDQRASPDPEFEVDGDGTR